MFTANLTVLQGNSKQFTVHESNYIIKMPDILKREDLVNFLKSVCSAMGGCNRIFRKYHSRIILITSK